MSATITRGRGHRNSCFQIKLRKIRLKMPTRANSLASDNKPSFSCWPWSEMTFRCLKYCGIISVSGTNTSTSSLWAALSSKLTAFLCCVPFWRVRRRKFCLMQSACPKSKNTCNSWSTASSKTGIKTRKRTHGFIAMITPRWTCPSLRWRSRTSSK